MKFSSRIISAALLSWPWKCQRESVGWQTPLNWGDRQIFWWHHPALSCGTAPLPPSTSYRARQTSDSRSQQLARKTHHTRHVPVRTSHSHLPLAFAWARRLGAPRRMQYRSASAACHSDKTHFPSLGKPSGYQMSSWDSALHLVFIASAWWLSPRLHWHSRFHLRGADRPPVQPSSGPPRHRFSPGINWFCPLFRSFSLRSCRRTDQRTSQPPWDKRYASIAGCLSGLQSWLRLSKTGPSSSGSLYL